MHDILSEILATVRLSATGWLTCELTAPWSIHVTPGFEQPFFFSVAGASCWLSLEGTPPIHMQEGDLLLILHGGGYVHASDLKLKPVAWEEIFPLHRVRWSNAAKQARPTTVTHGGGGAVTRKIGAVFGFRDPRRNPLLAALPPFIYLSNRDSQLLPWLQPTLDFLSEEKPAPGPGYFAVAERVAELLFINIIRAHLRVQPEQTTGWLRGLSDPRIARALAAIHQKPGEAWTVASLASVASMSRAAFAKQFHVLTGKAPGEYLLEWRIYLAAGRFASGNEPVASVAAELGYESVSAFIHAFKQQYGVTPSKYRESLGPVTTRAQQDS